MNVLDIWDQQAIFDILDDPLQVGDEPYYEFSPPVFWSYVYLPKSGALIVSARSNNLNITLKVNSLFSHNFLKTLKIMKRRGNSDPNNRVFNFGGDRVLILYSGEVRSTSLRPLAWLDPDTLKQTKISGFEKEGRSHLLCSTSHSADLSITKLSQNRMLVMNKYLAFIYDFEKDEPIAEQTYCFQRYGAARIINVDNLYVVSHCKYFHILRTQLDSEGEEVIEVLKVLHFNDLIPNLSLTQTSFGFCFFKLHSNNYLALASMYFEGDVRGNLDTPRLVSLEIDSKTLEVAKMKVVVPDEQLESEVDASEIEFVSGFIVFVSRIKTPQNGRIEPNQAGGSLVLADTEFNILDHCSEAKLREYSSLAAVHSNKIASHGLKNRIYLHKVNPEAKKLVLLKTVGLGNVKIQPNFLKQKNISSFCCEVRYVDESGRENSPVSTILLFNMDLELINHLKIENFCRLSSFYPIEGSRVVFRKTQPPNQGCLFMIDLETAAVKLVYQSDSKFGSIDYMKEYGPEGRIMSMELAGEKFVKVVLN